MAELTFDNMWADKGVTSNRTPQPATNTATGGRVDTFGQLYNGLGIGNQTTFDNMYRLNPPTQPAPGSGVPPIDPRVSNVNPATGRPYSFQDSLNDADGQLRYDPSQSMMWNIMNGRFRTGSDPTTGAINPTGRNDNFTQTLVNNGLMRDSSATSASNALQQSYQPQTPFASAPNTNGIQGLLQYLQGMGNNFQGNMSESTTRPLSDYRTGWEPDGYRPTGWQPDGMNANLPQLFQLLQMFGR